MTDGLQSGNQAQPPLGYRREKSPLVHVMPDPAPLPSRTTTDPIALSNRMRPSEYTAAALRVIEQRARSRKIQRAIDIGTGSGILLAALSRLGAEELWGVDIDPDALLAAEAMLAREALDKPRHLILSDVWHDVPRHSFDVIVANLPHFPANLPPSPGRSPGWSGGGRGVLDSFLIGLAAYLAIDGVAWMTHHARADLHRSEQILAGRGLVAETVFSWTVHESASRVIAVVPAILAAGERMSLRRIGDYYFVDAHVVEIRHAGSPRRHASDRVWAGTIE
jgi:release factor glutamine methyltransferase